VDARPSPEQRELAAAAGRLGERLGVRAVGDLDDADRRARLDAAMVQAGWRELRGGAPGEPLASGVEAALVVEALARRVCDVAVVGPLLAHDLLRRAGVAGDERSTIAVAADLAGLARGSGVALDAAACRQAVSLAPAGSTVTLTPIDPGAAPTAGGVDLTRAVVAVGDADPVEVGAVSDADLLAWEALAVTLSAADLVGVMAGAVTLSTDYARERRQFGVPVGSFQAVQHLLAEATTLTEGARSAVTYAAWGVDALDPAQARAAAAVAKAYAARAARTVCETAIQVHGGIGNTWECMAHVYLRRALLSAELFGGDGAQLALLARHRWGFAVGLP
jgi:hypothetical protein